MTATRKKWEPTDRLLKLIEDVRAGMDKPRGGNVVLPWKHGPIRVIAYHDHYFMVRYKGGMPFCIYDRDMADHLETQGRK